MKPNLTFEKWRNPLGFDIDETEILSSSIVKKTEKTSTYKDSDDEEEEERTQDEQIPRAPIALLHTTMGVIPMQEYSQPDKVFNFWVGHTNFNISPIVFNIIENVEGVEILDVFTRYRFRVGIGKIFEDGQVMRNIRKAVLQHVKQQS